MSYKDRYILVLVEVLNIWTRPATLMLWHAITVPSSAHAADEVLVDWVTF